MLITPNMTLTAWDLGTDAYDHAALANNFVSIDAHDHSSGKGKQISAAGITDNSITAAKIVDGTITSVKLLDGIITQAKLANNSVGSPQIIDGSITGADILDGTIGNAELDPSINSIGTIRLWYRVTGSVPIPTGWEVCDGRAWSSVTNAMGPGGTQWNTGNMPDFRNRFPLGAALSGTGSNPTDPPDIGQVGGAMQYDLTHTHTVNAHSHTVNAHTHSVATQADHKHQFVTTVCDSNNNPVGTTQSDARQRGSAVPSNVGIREATYIPGLNKNQYYGEDVAAPMTKEVYIDGSGNVLGSQPAHNHGGVTGSAGSTTTSDATATGAATGLTSTFGVRNSFVGVLYLIRVI